MSEVNRVHSSGPLFFAEFLDLIERESHFQDGAGVLSDDPLFGLFSQIFVGKSRIVRHGRLFLPPG
jgi:hypothetical protein